MNQQQLKDIENFLNQKGSASSGQGTADPEIKEIRKNFKTVTAALGSFVAETTVTSASAKERIQALVGIFERLSEIQVSFEEKSLRVKHNNAQIRHESDLIVNENLRVAELKDKYSKVCMELSDAIKTIKSGNKQMVEAETSQRQQLVENFENSLKDITSKIDEQDKDRELKEQENNEIKEVLKKKMGEFEDIEKQFTENLTSKDGEFKLKLTDLMDQIKSIESDAVEAMNLRKELLTLKSTETEKKLKIVVYSKRVDELVETIDKTNVTLTQFKDNILKMYWKQHKLEQQLADYKKITTKGEEGLLIITQKNLNVEEQIDSVKKQKESVKAKVLETQAKLKLLNQKSTVADN